MMGKVCVVTGTRAEYGLLRNLMAEIRQSSSLELQIIVTGMHLSPEFGLTVREIEADGFNINRRIEMLLSSDTPVGITKSMGVAMIGFADALAQLQPDLMLVLGDRYEIFAASSAAMIGRIPIAHLHGGEATEGLIDESIRHSITKMSHLHFVATEQYRQRVIQLGENPEHVFNVGGLGVDSIKSIKLLDRNQLEKELNLKFWQKNLLITFHPVTLEENSSAKQMMELLEALDQISDTQLIFTMPNADPDGRELTRIIDDFVTLHANARSFTSLGQLRYLSCINQVDGVVGNSSSGLLEVPSFKKGTINIGDRQRGRIRADSVIDCEPTHQSILSAIMNLYSKDFQSQLSEVKSPYGEGGATQLIMRVLENITLSGILKKQFYDKKFI